MSHPSRRGSQPGLCIFIALINGHSVSLRVHAQELGLRTRLPEMRLEETAAAVERHGTTDDDDGDCANSVPYTESPREKARRKSTLTSLFSAVSLS